MILITTAGTAQELNVIGSAVRAGVGHVVKITSKASADPPIARRRGQTEIENGLIASGLGCTLLLPHRSLFQPPCTRRRPTGLPGPSGSPARLESAPSGGLTRCRFASSACQSRRPSRRQMSESIVANLAFGVAGVRFSSLAGS